MVAYRVRVVDLTGHSGIIVAIRLEKPSGFDFKAGQWTIVTLPHRGISDDKGLSRPLSIASAPSEDFLLFATRLSESAFKKTLQALSPGDEIVVDNPRGDLILPEKPDGPIVMIAGGIGITPFRSMVVQALKTGWNSPLALFYSCKTPEEAVFIEEFTGWSRRVHSFAFVPTMTRVSRGEAGWDGETGRITPEMIEKHFSLWRDASYFVTGPPPMVQATKEMLIKMGVSNERIRLERFGVGR